MLHQPRRQTPAPRGRRQARRWVRRFALGLLLADAGALGAAPADAAGTFDLRVSSNQAVFQVNALKPGPVGQRCLVLRALNGSADLALLWASAGGSGLGTYLDIVLERGPAAGAGNCATLAATPLYSGTLTDLAATHSTPALGLAVPFDPTSDATVRITISLRDDNAAQGLDASAVFSFQADDTAPAESSTTVPELLVPTTAPPASRPPATTASGSTPGSTLPTSGAATSNSGTTIAATTGSVVVSNTTPTFAPRPTAVRRSPTGEETAVTTAAASESPGVVVFDPTAPAADPGFFPSIPEAVKTTATITAKAGSVPAAFLAIVFLFLLVQDRFDRNDPKLARAPLRPDPDVAFLPRYEVPV